MPRVGVISDTHNFLDPQVAEHFAGVEHIVHAGDIGHPAILAELAAVAPVTAVAGNTDDDGFGWRESEVVAIGQRRWLVHHIVDPDALAPAVRRLIGRAQPDVVVFGHTHRPYQQHRDGVLLLNPGSAGRARFGLPRTIAVVDHTPTALDVQFIPLGP